MSIGHELFRRIPLKLSLICLPSVIHLVLKQEPVILV